MSEFLCLSCSFAFLCDDGCVFVWGECGGRAVFVECLPVSVDVLNNEVVDFFGYCGAVYVFVSVLF